MVDKDIEKINEEDIQNVLAELGNDVFVANLNSGITKDRRIYLFGDVNQQNILSVIDSIFKLQDESDEDIELIINSGGGLVVECFALVDVMDSCKCDIKVTVLGLAASAACLIASNGTPGKRYAGKNAEFMFHEIFGDVPSMRQSDLRYVKEDTTKRQNRFNSIFSRNTGQPVGMISKFFYGRNHDRYMTTKDAIKFGIIDKVILTKKRINTKDKKSKKEE